MLLSGKHTNRAGVSQVRTQSGDKLDVTDLERTLIDAVVRPAYTGGIEQVASAYVKAATSIDVDHVLDLLRQLDHVYPYHQAIGFLLERAGRSNADCRKFEALGKQFDFYLDYGVKQRLFNKKWRLYYPACLD
jgi:predicted transcriptional regulator of viral defense system